MTKKQADRIVYPEQDMGTRVAYNLASLKIIDSIELSPEYSIDGIKVNSRMGGQTLRELKLRKRRYGINVLAEKSKAGVQISPGADEKLEPGNILVVMGPRRGLEEMVKRF